MGSKIVLQKKKKKKALIIQRDKDVFHIPSGSLQNPQQKGLS